MGWLKIDDRFTDHAKVDGLSDRAFRLHMRALCHCSRDLTDGGISAKALKVLLVKNETVTPKARTAVIEELLVAELWHPDGDGGYRVNDYLEYNPSSVDVKERQEQLRKVRSDAGRRGAEARWKDGKHGKPDSNSNGNVVMAPSRPVVKELKPLAVESEFERLLRASRTAKP